MVLYILLCGRPPFNSKSNREVLEKTAKGVYRLSGAEWDDVSHDAKDLVRKMLHTNPFERITTEEILEHPWIKGIDDDRSDSTSSASTSTDLSSSLGNNAQLVSTLVKASGGNRKPSSHSNNLSGALRLLSGHVQHLRSEKLASSMTRIVSLMQSGGPGARSTLSQLYLVPAVRKGGTAVVSGAAPPSSGAASGTAGDGSSKVNSSAENNVAKMEEDEDLLVNTNDVEMLFLNSEVRASMVAALSDVVESDRLTLEQFIVLAKHFNTALKGGGGGAAAGGASAGVGVVHLLLCRFVDRDGDGLISVDDLFAAQAQVLQRSESFLRVRK